MKSYCDLNQCKVLMEFLPYESADMFYTPANVIIDGVVKYCEPILHKPIWNPEEAIPCWSLAALLSVIPKRIKDYNVLRIDTSVNDFSMWYDEIGFGVNDELPEITEESAVDACYEMIIKLHKKNLL